jgi:hypothetical protein
MRIAALGLAAAITLALSANAAPIAAVGAHENVSNITKVAGGCGVGFHRNGWGSCVPNRYGYYSRPYYGYPAAPYYSPRRCWDPYRHYYYAC